MKLICKQLGGSHSYGLNTATSDTDYRGIYLNQSIGDIIGLGRDEHHQKQGGGDDEVYTEFRNALKLLRGANTQMVELLFNDEWIEISPDWVMVQKNRSRLVSSEKLFSCLRGYMQGELKLANGERTGKLGGKRKSALDKYGFSPKNFVQLFRLAWAGCIYFQKGHFPVNVLKEDTAFAETLLEIKTRPETVTRTELNERAAQWESKLVEAFENRKFHTNFSEEVANELSLRVYGPIVMKTFMDKALLANVKV